ncbi:MAG TPA: hypothetical protein VM010_05015 [Chitinophagaceae bacterium]|nr:hypothetical protein [Chitinophagaceae bacterium]
MRTQIYFLLFFLLVTAFCNAQILTPGFDAAEYLELLSVSSRQGDSVLKNDNTPAPQQYKQVYRSPVVGLDNRWDLWLRTDKKVAVISIRGTTASPVSWLENFYSAMIPASGQLQLADSTIFPYRFAADEKATVHAGWSIGLAHLAPTIEAQILKWHAKGVTNFYIMGHSQGGAIAFLLRSYLFYKIKAGGLPADLRFKTYCSAAPKPGNLYYAYDYEYLNREGWSYTVVNALDWVPETPFSIQQVTDVNSLNPFVGIDAVLKKQNVFVRTYMRHVYGKLRRSTGKAARTYTNYLGTKMFKMVRKTLPQLRQPAYAPGMNYMRAGVPIVLQPDEAYLKKFNAGNPHGVFYHHFFEAYRSLIQSGYVK